MIGRESSLRSESKSRPVRIENNILALQEDIAEDGEAQAGVALDTTEAGRASFADGGVVDILPWNNGLVVSDDDGEVGQLGVAVESVATGLRVVLGALHVLVVVVDDGFGEEKEGSAGV